MVRLACDLGWFVAADRDASGKYACVPCRPGSFKDSIDAAGCILCAAGTYSTSSAATHCDRCADNATSPVGSTSASACFCKAGFDGDGRVNCSAIECDWNTSLPCSYGGCMFDKTTGTNTLQRSGSCSGHSADLYLNSKGIEFLPAGVFDSIAPL